MVKSEQLELAEGLCDNIKIDVLKAVLDMPETWNGLQIRQFVAEVANRYVCQMSRKQKHDYRNDVAVLGL